jgi:ribosome-binding factor A
LRFHYDDSFDTGMRVAELLSDVSKLNIDESDK